MAWREGLLLSLSALDHRRQPLQGGHVRAADRQDFRRTLEIVLDCIVGEGGEMRKSHVSRVILSRGERQAREAMEDGPQTPFDRAFERPIDLAREVEHLRTTERHQGVLEVEVS